MKQIVRIVAWLVGSLALLIIVLALVAPLIIDPNDYRDEIASVVERSTGRELAIEGELDLSVFPWLGLEVGEMRLSNAEGFGPEPFAHIGTAEVRVKLLPLLARRVEVGTVVLEGLRLNLARAGTGQSNWDDLVQPGPEDEGKPRGRAFGALAIGGIRLRDAQIEWDDRLSGTRYAVRDLNLTSSAVAFDQPIPIELTTRFTASQPELTGDLSLESVIRIASGGKRIAIEGIELVLNANGPALPGDSISARFAAELLADLEAETLTLADFTGQLAGITLRAEASGTKLLSAPRFTGRATLDEFVLRRVMEELGVAVPESADPSVLGKAALAFGFDATPTSVALSNLNLQVDDTRVTGRFAASRFDPPVLSWEITADAINLDRYLPPPTEEESNGGGSPASAAAAGAAQLPVDLLRSLRADGTVRLGQLQAINLKSTDIVATLKAADGVLQMQPLGANLYEGRYAGNVRLDVRGDQPRFAIDEKLEGVQSGPLLADLMGKAHVTGVANVSANLTGTGIDPEQVKRTVSGKAAFRFSNGAVQGVNIGHLIRQARATIRGEPAPPEESAETDFTELSGTLAIKDGLVQNNDLDAKSPLLRIGGEGTVNLVSEKIDYLVRASVVGTSKGQSGKEIEDLKGLTIPVRIGGSLGEPKFRVDMEELLQGRVDKEIEQQKEQLKEKLEKRLEEELKGKTEDKAKEKLRGLFKR